MAIPRFSWKSFQTGIVFAAKKGTAQTSGGYTFPLNIRLLWGMILFFGIPSAANAATAYPGYIFTASGQNAYLIDPSGATVHTWKATSSAQSHADLLPDGSALFPMQPNTTASTLLTNPTSCPMSGMSGGFPQGRLQQINWDNQVVWDCIVCDATFTPAYDAEPIAKQDGTFTVLVGGISSSNGVKLVEIKPLPPTGKEVIWEWDLPSTATGSGFLNSISYNPDLGEGGYIAINYNGGKKIVVLDKAKKSVVCTYSVTTGSLNHAVKWVTPYFSGTLIKIPDANSTAMRLNNILVVNNNIKAIELNFNPTGNTLTLAKDFTYSFSAHEGCAQRLPNGNTLLQNGMSSAKITEVDDNGATVRTLNAPGSVNRAYMWGLSYPGLKNYTRVTTVAPVAAAAGRFTYNAAAGIGTVTIGGFGASLLDLRVISLSGKTVHSSLSKGTTAEFSTKRLMAGVYYISVKHASGTIGASFVKMQ